METEISRKTRLSYSMQDLKKIQEKETEKAFSKQALIFDDIYGSNPIIQYKRERVRGHVLKFIKSGSEILELNSGTGEDAIWFAQNGFLVHATDISEGMQEMLVKKIHSNNLDSKITYEICSFNDLSELKNKGPFDSIFSNFAGLNCTGELNKVLDSFDPLLKPGGIVTLVILPRFCLWETLLFFRGNFKTAFRRFFSKNGVKAHIEGEYFTCWYYDPSYVINRMNKKYTILDIEGLCTIVPPSYLENFPMKRPGLFMRLKKLEMKYKNSWPWKSIGDYYIISMQKK